jgi:hypothetical protein
MGQFGSTVQILKIGTDIAPEMSVISELLTQLTAQVILLPLAAIKTADLTFIIKYNFITITADS